MTDVKSTAMSAVDMFLGMGVREGDSERVAWMGLIFRKEELKEFWRGDEPVDNPLLRSHTGRAIVREIGRASCRERV